MVVELFVYRGYSVHGNGSGRRLGIILIKMACALWSGRLTQDCSQNRPGIRPPRTYPVAQDLWTVQLPGGLGLNRVIRARRLAACTQEAGCQLAPSAQRLTYENGPPSLDPTRGGPLVGHSTATEPERGEAVRNFTDTLGAGKHSGSIIGLVTRMPNVACLTAFREKQASYPSLKYLEVCCWNDAPVKVCPQVLRAFVHVERVQNIYLRVTGDGRP
ncbi:hypothetical protein C8R43DRAFT_946231 [Mycena crocata]|nr:hypothetical protein C8R43DRAFT_946231 [Mycena crocata]